MAVFKTDQLKSLQNGRKLDAPLRGVVREAKDSVPFTVSQLSTPNDLILTAIKIPSNANVSRLLYSGEELDPGATLLVRIGVYAVEDFKVNISGTLTEYLAEQEIEKNFFRQTGVLAAGRVDYTELFTNNGLPESSWYQPAYKLLGFDEDPLTEFRCGVLIDTAATTPTEGAAAFIVQYTTN